MLWEAASLAERFLIGVDAGLPFGGRFFPDMVNYLLHLSQPIPNFTPPLADGGMMRIGGDSREVPLDFG
jgi:hypothetical protein